MDANLYQSKCVRTIVDLEGNSFMDHLTNGAIGMSVESSEVLQHIQKCSYCGKGLDLLHLLEECGDVLWYISYVLHTLGYTLEDCMKHNINKLEDRYADRVQKYEKGIKG